MTNLKKLFTVVLTVVLVGSNITTYTKAYNVETNDTSNTITILHTNDVHCGGVDDSSSAVAPSGYAKLAAYKNSLEVDGQKNVIMVDAGDHIQGETIGTLTKGSAIVDIMNKIGYDVAIPGNHEFDYQMTTFNARKNQANYPYISANFYDLKTNKPYLDQYKIIEALGHKIGFVGISTPETYTKSTPKYFQDDDGNYIYSFMESDFYNTIQSGIDACKAAGAEKVVALAHTGMTGTTEEWNSENIIKNTTGIDLYIDGHSHDALISSFTSKDNKTVPYAQTGTKLANIGRVDITVESDSSLTISTPVSIATNDLTDTDSEVLALLTADNELVKNFAGESVGSSEITLYAKDPSTGNRISYKENPLGDFIADAYKWKTKADIGLINSGGIRADINKGNLIANNLISVNPWMNDVGVIEATGQTILDALEHSARLAPNVNNGFLQVSGISYDINYNVETPVTLNDDGSFKSIDSSKERRVKNVYVNGVELDASKTYTLGSTLYLLQNAGDGYTMFSDCTLLQGEDYVFPTDAEILIDYMKNALGGKITEEQYGKELGRINVVDDRSNPIYRLYNKRSGEHLFTSKEGEYNKLGTIGWTQEGKAFDGFTEDTKPVNANPIYRVFNPKGSNNLGDHHYTKSYGEAKKLVSAGWKWDNDGKPLLYSVGSYNVTKLYDKKTGHHHYTPKSGEVTNMKAAGWVDEGLAWSSAGYYTSKAHTISDVENIQIDILHTNDVHCGGIDSSDSAVAPYGYAKLAAYKASLENDENVDGVITVDAGDHIQGETIGTLTKGSAIIEIMNMIGYDVATPGNHEFDYQMSTFDARRKEADFPYISSNFYSLETNKPYLDQYKIVEVDGVNVGFVGISTPETYTKSTPKYFQDDDGNYIYSFMENDFYDTIQSGVDACKDAGADYVIALAHTGIDGSQTEWNSQSIISNTTGIDLYIDGHSHEANTATYTNKNNENVLYTQTGTKLANIGRITLEVDPFDLETSASTTLVDTNSLTETDSVIKYLSDEDNQLVTDFAGESVGKSEVTLYAKDPETNVRISNKETALGNFIADAYKWKTGADIGIINSGGIRANINEGDLIANNLISVNPWMNDVGVIEATGQTILDALEHSARLATESNNGFLQVSGITFEIDTSVTTPVVLNDDGSFKEITEGASRRISNVKVNGVALDPSETYTIGSTLYLLQNAGDGYTMFSDCKLLQGAEYVFPTDAEILILYMKEKLNGLISANDYGSTKGRITIK